MAALYSDESGHYCGICWNEYYNSLVVGWEEEWHKVVYVEHPCWPSGKHAPPQTNTCRDGHAFDQIVCSTGRSCSRCQKSRHYGAPMHGCIYCPYAMCEDCWTERVLPHLGVSVVVHPPVVLLSAFGLVGAYDYG